MGWTDKRVATLKKLWLDGLSASQIAKQLGGVTRNAVIGKVHRLGLSGRASPSAPPAPCKREKPSAPRRVVAAAPRPPRPPSKMPQRKEEPDTPPPEVRAEEPGSATVLTLGAYMCKWPIGDPMSDSFTFCGRGTLREGRSGRPSFCELHAGSVYQPQKRGKRDAGEELYRSVRAFM